MTAMIVGIHIMYSGGMMDAHSSALMKLRIVAANAIAVMSLDLCLYVAIIVCFSPVVFFLCVEDPIKESNLNL